MIKPLINLFIIRPYVILFLIAFLFLAIKRWGVTKSLVWLVSGYLLAWASEFSSVHNGFPYGEYYYVYENLRGELLFFGVPFFDSLSYAFLTFAGFTTAEYFLDQKQATESTEKNKKTLRTLCPLWIKKILLGAFLTMMLDVIIDPVATMGEKWFLGKIHYYAHPGWYFGIPLTNFAGWFLVSFVIIGFNLLCWKFFFKNTPDAVRQTPYDTLCVLFYVSIALFSIFMSFWIHQWLMGVASLIILTVLFVMLWILKKHGRQN